MAMAIEIMRGGLSAGAAKAINGGVAATLAAAGTTQGTATAINAGHNVITTVAASQGVILPACEIADEIFVWNGTGTNAVTVYPDSGSTINQLSTNIGVLLAPYTGAIFKRATTTAWWANLSA